MSAEAELRDVLQALIGSSRPSREHMRTYLRLVSRLQLVQRWGSGAAARGRPGLWIAATHSQGPVYQILTLSMLPQAREVRQRDPETIARYGLQLLQSKAGIPEEECEYSLAARASCRIPAF